MNCSEKCKKEQTPCKEKECRHWIDYKEDLNCVLICAKENGPLSLHETSKRIGVSFVRIKQIQDKAMIKMGKRNRKLALLINREDTKK